MGGVMISLILVSALIATLYLVNIHLCYRALSGDKIAKHIVAFGLGCLFSKEVVVYIIEKIG